MFDLLDHKIVSLLNQMGGIRRNIYPRSSYFLCGCLYVLHFCMRTAVVDFKETTPVVRQFPGYKCLSKPLTNYSTVHSTFGSRTIGNTLDIVRNISNGIV